MASLKVSKLVTPAEAGVQTLSRQKPGTRPKKIWIPTGVYPELDAGPE